MLSVSRPCVSTHESHLLCKCRGENHANVCQRPLLQLHKSSRHCGLSSRGLKLHVGMKGDGMASLARPAVSCFPGKHCQCTAYTSIHKEIMCC